MCLCPMQMPFSLLLNLLEVKTWLDNMAIGLLHYMFLIIFINNLKDTSITNAEVEILNG